MADTTLLDDLDDSTPIGSCLNAWHRLFLGDPDALDAVLADEVVLHSPVLFTPITGKDLVALYLTGASMTFVNAATPAESAANVEQGEWNGGFRYVRVLTGERDAVLEFETTMDGKYVNGVDIIRCNELGRIVEFRVMIRPLKAIDALHQRMGEMLEQLQ